MQVILDGMFLRLLNQFTACTCRNKWHSNTSSWIGQSFLTWYLSICNFSHDSNPSSSLSGALVFGIELIFWCVLHVNIVFIDRVWARSQVLSNVIRIAVVRIVGVGTWAFVWIVACVRVATFITTVLLLWLVDFPLILSASATLLIDSACISWASANSAVLSHLHLLLLTECGLFLLSFHHLLLNQLIINLL